jgi:hypothetical protein
VQDELCLHAKPPNTLSTDAGQRSTMTVTVRGLREHDPGDRRLMVPDGSDTETETSLAVLPAR